MPKPEGALTYRTIQFSKSGGWFPIQNCLEPRFLPSFRGQKTRAPIFSSFLGCSELRVNTLVNLFCQRRLSTFICSRVQDSHPAPRLVSRNANENTKPRFSCKRFLRFFSKLPSLSPDLTPVTRSRFSRSNRLIGSQSPRPKASAVPNCK